MPRAQRVKRLTLDEAAERMLAILEEHAARLPLAEREKRWEAFTRAADKIRAKRAKPGSPLRTRAARLPGRTRI